MLIRACDRREQKERKKKKNSKSASTHFKLLSTLTTPRRRGNRAIAYSQQQFSFTLKCVLLGIGGFVRSLYDMWDEIINSIVDNVSIIELS